MLNKVYPSRAKELRKQFLSAKPYPHLALPNCFNEIEKVENALLAEKFTHSNSDLFEFQQTNDLSKTKNKVLKEFHKFFSSKKFLKFMSKVTGEKLTSIDMSGFVYSPGDYLLPHDDRLEGRKIAYIVNLSRDFNEEDGGALQLFEGKEIVKSIVPIYNTLAFFKVSPKSLHQVQEVLGDKNRISLAGWFHG